MGVPVNNVDQWNIIIDFHTYHRHPIVSATTPPMGVPLAEPIAYKKLPTDCHTPRSRNGTRSFIKIVTMGISPAPPMPARAYRRSLRSAQRLQ